MFSYLLNQYKHLHWANRKLLSVLSQDGDVLSEAVGLMSHIVSAEHIWLARIGGQEEALAPWSRLSVPDCEAYAAANSAGYLNIIAQLDEGRLEESISFKLTNGTPMTSTLGDILSHVVVHGAHHRGQVARIIAQNGMEVPAIDYIVYRMQSDE